MFYLSAMKYLMILPILIVLVSTTSCTAYLKLVVEEPAQINLPDSADVVGIINNVDMVRNNRKSIGELLSNQLLNNTQLASVRAVDGSFNSVIAHKGRSIEFNNDSIRFIDNTLNWLIIDSLARRDSIDAFIVFDECTSMIPLGQKLLQNLGNSQNSQVNQRIKGKLMVTYYGVAVGDTLGSKIIEKSVDVTVFNSSSIAANNARRRAGHERLGYDLGYGASEMFYAHRVSVTRMYYKYGSPSVKAARKFIAKKNWDQAEIELLKNVDDGKAGPRGRGLYNLACVKEAQGDLDAAILYAERSAEECFNNEAKSYLVKLLARRPL